MVSELHRTEPPAVGASGRGKQTGVRWTLRAVVFAVIAWAVWHYIDLRQVFSVLRDVDLAMVGVLILLITVDRTLMAVKWRQLLLAAGQRAPLRLVWSAYYRASFVSRTLPVAIGGDVLRAHALTRNGNRWQAVLGTMLAEKVIGVASGLTLALCGLLLLSGRLLNARGLDAATIGTAAAVLAILAIASVWLGKRQASRLGRWVIRLVERFLPKHRVGLTQRLLRTYRPVVVPNYLLAITEQTLQLVILGLCAIAVGVTASPWLLFAVLAVTELMRKVAIAAEGWGLAQLVVVTICALAGIDQNLALGMALLNHVLELIVTAPAGLLMVLFPDAAEADLRAATVLEAEPATLEQVSLASRQ